MHSDSLTGRSQRRTAGQQLPEPRLLIDKFLLGRHAQHLRSERCCDDRLNSPIPYRTRTHTHLKQESAFAARRLRVHNDSMVNEGEVMIVAYDHVQVAIPSGAEAVDREYYGGLLGMVELPKPAVLAARGGCWFTAGVAVLHLGIEADFRAARKAHPAFLVKDLDVVERTIRLAGHETTRSDNEIQGC